MTKVKLVKVKGRPQYYCMEQRPGQREGLIGRKLCWRRVMRVSWMERQTDVGVLENMKPGWTLESRMAQTHLRFLDMW